MSERSPNTSREAIAEQEGISYVDALKMSNSEVQEKMSPMSDIEDVVKVGKTGTTAHRPDGSGKFLSKYEQGQIRAHQGEIRNTMNDSRQAARTEAQNPSPAELAVQIQGFLPPSAEAAQLQAAAELANDEEVVTPQKRSALKRLHNKFTDFKNAFGARAATFGSGLSDQNFRESMSAKSEGQAKKGNLLRSRALWVAGALGATATLVLAFRASRLTGVEIAHAAEGLGSGGAHLSPQQLAEIGSHHNGSGGNHHHGSDPSQAHDHQPNAAHHDYHYFDHNKEGVHDFGKSLDLDSKKASIADMQDRYKEDPALLAAHMAAFDPNIDNSDINQLANELDKNPKFMTQSVAHLLELEKGYSSHVEKIDQNYSSLYMQLGPDGKPNVYQDQLVENRGTMIVFTDHQGHKVEIRRECGAQIIQEKEFVNVPHVNEIPTPTHSAVVTPHHGTPHHGTTPQHHTTKHSHHKPETHKDTVNTQEKTKIEKGKTVIIDKNDVTKKETVTAVTPSTETVTETPPATPAPVETPPPTQPPVETPPPTQPPVETPPPTQPPVETPPPTHPPELTPKDPTKDINVNPDIAPTKQLGNQAGTIPTGPVTHPTHPQETYTPPPKPQPEVGQPAQPAPAASPNPAGHDSAGTPTPPRAPVTSSPEGPDASNSPSIPKGDATGKTSNGSAGSSNGV